MVGDRMDANHERGAASPATSGMRSPAPRLERIDLEPLDSTRHGVVTILRFRVVKPGRSPLKRGLPVPGLLRHG